MPRMPRPWRRKGSGGAWYAQVGGVQVRLADGDRPHAEALESLYRLLAERDRSGGAPARSSLLVGELVDLFLDRVKAERKPATFAWYRRHLYGLAGRWGELAAEELRPRHVTAWLDGRTWGRTTRRPLGPGTRRGAIVACQALTSWGRKAGHTGADPLEGMDKPPPRRREAVLSAAQAETLLAATAATPFGELMAFLRETGARPGEAAALSAADVDLARGLAVLAEHKTEAGTGRPRVIALSAAAREMLGRRMAERPEGPLFLNARGRPWTRNAMSLAFRRWRPKLAMGREATAQAMRHRFATEAAATLPNSVVAALLGHRSTAMVDRVYSHLSEEHDALREAVERVRPGPAPLRDGEGPSGTTGGG